MTYLIRRKDKNKNVYILKAFDKNKPIWITEAQYNSGKPFYEFGTEQQARWYAEKILKNSDCRGLSIVEIH